MRISDHTLNRLTVLKAILRHGPVARSDLPGLTGLSAGLITLLTAELVDSEMVVEERVAGAGRGRPRVLLRINGQGAIVVGASIDGMDGLRASFVNLSGDLLHEVTATYGNHPTLTDLALRMGGALAEAIDGSPFSREQIARVGLALPAMVDSARGEVHFNTTFAVEPTPFAEPIAAIIGIPVTIENPLDCMARAAHWFGRASADLDFTLIRVGFSVDSAEFANGVPKFGANGLNPMFGHVKTETGDGARVCYCGMRGCMTAYASMYGMLEGAGELAGLPFPPLAELPGRFADFIARAEAREARALDAITQAAQHFALALGNYVNVANPRVVYVSVDHPSFLPLLEGPVRAALDQIVSPGILPLTRIEFMQTDYDWRWAGTAALALEQLYLEDSRNVRRTVRERTAVKA